MDEGLQKARRNLIVVSVVLILFDFAKISIGEVSILGTNLIIGNPAVVYTFIWVLWGYLLLRYSQYLAEKEDLGIAILFSQIASKHLYFEIEKRVKAHDLSKNYNNYGYKFLRRTGFLKWEIPLQYYDISEGTQISGGSIPIPSNKVISASLNAALHVTVKRPNVTEYILPFALAFTAPIVTLWG